MSSTERSETPSSSGEPAWEVAHFFPLQGNWTEGDYFRIESNRPAELVNGRLEVLPMPTWMHQLIVEYLFDRLRESLRGCNIGGRVMMAPLPVQLFPGTIREPDVFYLRSENLPKPGQKYPDKLDLALEVVSEGNEARQRVYVSKLSDYDKAGVEEYWIIDPIEKVITVY